MAGRSPTSKGVLILPTYDYSCTSCGVTAELHVPINDRGAGRECPQCGQAMKRVFSSGRVAIRVPKPRTR
jgi:putative FmdB family regulatory protein